MKKYINHSVILGVLGLWLLISCQDSNTESHSLNESSIPESSLKDKVYKNGDIEAYNILKTQYLDYPSEDFLYWALLMANKYNYPSAYFDVYYTLKNTVNTKDDSLDKLDERTKLMALEYLLLAKEKGSELANEKVNRYCSANQYETYLKCKDR